MPSKERCKSRNAIAYRPVPITRRSHLFPFRTQKLSSVVPKILGWRRPGKIGRCRLSLCPFLGPLPNGRGPFSLRPGRGPLFTAKPCARRRSARDAASMRCRDGNGRLLSHGGKGQDQAALLAEKRKDRLLQVPAKKKERSPGRCGIRERSFFFLKTAHGRQSSLTLKPMPFSFSARRGPFWSVPSM